VLIWAKPPRRTTHCSRSNRVACVPFLLRPISGDSFPATGDPEPQPSVFGPCRRRRFGKCAHCEKSIGSVSTTWKM
jgi:hypothetical protein